MRKWFAGLALAALMCAPVWGGGTIMPSEEPPPPPPVSASLMIDLVSVIFSLV